jgi:hypothetical protein
MTSMLETVTDVQDHSLAAMKSIEDAVIGRVRAHRDSAEPLMKFAPDVSVAPIAKDTIGWIFTSANKFNANLQGFFTDLVDAMPTKSDRLAPVKRATKAA